MIFSGIRSWMRDDKANAAIEAGFLFPVMMVILCGMIDMGIGLVINQKTINSSQMVADLVGREEDLTDAEVEDAIVAGRMAFHPYATDSYGVDVVGIQFVGVGRVPTVRWRDTVNMDENGDVLAGSQNLGEQNEGVIAVTVRYLYQPYFSDFILGDLQMEEVAYVRGRKGLFVTRS